MTLGRLGGESSIWRTAPTNQIIVSATPAERPDLTGVFDQLG